MSSKISSTSWNVLLEYLDSDFEKKLYQAILKNLEDTNNPLRYNNFAYSMRELVRHILKRVSPDNNIKNTEWYVIKKSICKNNDIDITRMDRLKYCIQGGLSDSFLQDELEININPLLKSLKCQIDELSKYTHIEKNSFNIHSKLVKKFTSEFMTLLIELFSQIYTCRKSIINHLEHKINKDVVEHILSDVVADIDLLSTHSYIEEIYIDGCEITNIDHEFIYITVHGEIEVELTYGSDSDRKNMSGTTLYDSFPFTFRTVTYVDNLDELILENSKLDVDTSKWYQ